MARHCIWEYSVKFLSKCCSEILTQKQEWMDVMCSYACCGEPGVISILFPVWLVEDTGHAHFEEIVTLNVEAVANCLVPYPYMESAE